MLVMPTRGETTAIDAREGRVVASLPIEAEYDTRN